MKTSTTSQRIHHLLSRAGFGPKWSAWSDQKDQSVADVWKSLVKGSKKSQTLKFDMPPPLTRELRMSMSEEELRERRTKSRQDVRVLNSAWVRQMAHSDAQLREKATVFWHDHFACRLNNAEMVWQQNKLLRDHALGSFRKMLHAVAKNPAMLQFLNNQQNRKQHPNENFARELLELFTLGRGHYTEEDIQEAARAFTGWGFNPLGEFVFRYRQHDNGKKTFMGKTGNFSGEDILDMVLDNPRTAEMITEKLYRYYVSEQVDQAVIKKWARLFYESDYDILALMHTMFLSDHFYEQQHMGTHVKSPVELLIGMMRQLEMDMPDEGILMMQRVLGQILFQPPNVSGWPSGRYWLDSSSLLVRLQWPNAVILGEELRTRMKASFAGNEDVTMSKGGKFYKRMKGTIDWQSIEKELNGKQPDQRVSLLAEFLYGSSNQGPASKKLALYAKNLPGEEIPNLLSRMMCTPEYQLC
ncbi:DUF1800 domain-containing protein [Pontibacter sp. G13]|uniref:DUF1800 domain-containing protein n=1 Tax=Pontibacter sp. G13 TaxID=3074898 RepID=UPI00288B5AFC|nr:DUF1800 domain-containing protein [Pontibacter sp. G13]WNJ21031.1 DUF1800 domain-containing protein [Pontibacter sp. G13]